MLLLYNNLVFLPNILFYQLQKSNKKVEAGEGIEPPTSAYETDKIPFLYPAANGGG